MQQHSVACIEVEGTPYTRCIALQLMVKNKLDDIVLPYVQDLLIKSLVYIVHTHVIIL